MPVEGPTQREYLRTADVLVGVFFAGGAGIIDGQTVVLGGIYETERRETISKVPFLGDIPAVGVLFRSKQLQNDKSELLIFVTPRILEEGSTIY